MLHNDKHEGWQKLCDCNEGRVQFHTATTYLGGDRDCSECDGAGSFEADLADFDGKTVRLHTGETVYIESGMFCSMDGDELRKADVDAIAAVLESELA